MSYAEELEPGIYGETDPGRLNAIIDSLASGMATGQLGASLPFAAKGAYGVLKGLGNAGEMALGGSSEAAQGAKAINQGLKALTVPEEAIETLSVLGKGPKAADLVAELKNGLLTAKPKDVITLSNGAKWRFDGVQKVGDKSEMLLEHLEGPVPVGVRQGVSTTLTTLENASKGTTAIAPDIAAQKALMLTEDTGGATMNLTKGNLAGTPHYSVSIYPERELITKGELTTKEIEAYMEKNKDLLSDPTNSLGIWKDAESGSTYLDVVVTTPDKAAALKLGAENGQKAIFDLGSMQEIRLGKGK
jgi:hypothetical protein